MIEIFNDDCLVKMANIPNSSIDLILTDPPYGTTPCKWDSIIPFDQMWLQINRISKPNAAIILFAAEPFATYLRMSNIKNYKYDWFWHKHHKTGYLNAKIKPMKCIENIIVFSNKKHIYIPQNLIPFNKIVKNSNSKMNINKHNKTSTVSGNINVKHYKQEFTNYPSELIQFKSMNNNKLHPTQKPVDLLEYLINTYTLENETVLDFTMGSGSTGVAAINTNRSFIGIERDKKYFEIAQNRIYHK